MGTRSQPICTETQRRRFWAAHFSIKTYSIMVPNCWRVGQRRASLPPTLDDAEAVPLARGEARPAMPPKSLRVGVSTRGLVAACRLAYDVETTCWVTLRAFGLACCHL
jgi:hypothetical protein